MQGQLTTRKSVTTTYHFTGLKEDMHDTPNGYHEVYILLSYILEISDVYKKRTIQIMLYSKGTYSVEMYL